METVRTLRRSRTMGMAAIVVVIPGLALTLAACGGINANSSGAAATTTSSTSSPTGKPGTTTKVVPTTTAPSAPHIGQVAKDGDFAFTVTKVQCGVTQLGTTTFGTTAPSGSQWCLVSMTVANDKSQSQTFSSSNQYAIDSSGKKLSADTKAIFSLKHDTQAEFTTVNPGVHITVVVPFELASSDTIAKFELHDSAFSGGVTVLNKS